MKCRGASLVSQLITGAIVITSSVVVGFALYSGYGATALELNKMNKQLEAISMAISADQERCYIVTHEDRYK